MSHERPRIIHYTRPAMDDSAPEGLEAQQDATALAAWEHGYEWRPAREGEAADLLTQQEAAERFMLENGLPVDIYTEDDDPEDDRG
ncbi:hypothetical protein [Micromonospora sp. WMMD736]|uniref:hypothetical protein n=1 Tax=Micromonospora sp. WMMD736 TaxID=3404112 RepID=UPI003B95A4F4